MMSGTVSMSYCYDIRSFGARENTMSVEDLRLPKSHDRPMITHDEIMAEMRERVAHGLLRPKDIGEALGLPSPRVSEMLKGRRRIQQDEMPKLAKLLGLGEQTNVRKIKRIGRVPAGALREALQEAAGTLEVSANLPKGVFALEVDGESMNKIAPFGCDVIVDPNDKSLFSGDLYVLSEGGEFTFKRFLQDPARLVPLSSDTSHVDIPLGDQPINIVGRVVSVLIGAEHLRKMQ